MSSRLLDSNKLRRTLTTHRHVFIVHRLDTEVPRQCIAVQTPAYVLLLCPSREVEIRGAVYLGEITHIA